MLANGLATALLAGDWKRDGMLLRGRAAVGASRTPRWLTTLVREVLEAYRDPPADRPRELAAFLPTTTGWQQALELRREPRVLSWTPVPTTIDALRWPVTPLPHLAALARLLDLDQGELAWFADVRNQERTVLEPLRHYRWSTRPKAAGVRVLAAPKPRLAEIQRRLLRHLLRPIPQHPASHGGVRGRSVATAVAPHCGRTTVIRADLTGFFGSIRPGRVWELLRTAGLPEGVAHTVTGLVTTSAPTAFARLDPGLRHPHLPQGAPTSPALAGLVSYSLDRRLAGLAGHHGVAYTRYVDDLIFSGGPRLRDRRSWFVERVRDIVRDEGFRVNERKTVVLGDAGRQAVLGTVVNHHPTVPRPERDALRAVLHNCEVHGWRSQVRGQDDLRTHILGRIAWVNALDPGLGRRLRERFDRIDWS